jgi:hypothetical protein
MKTIFFTFITSIVLLSASCASQQALGGGSSPLQEATSLAANMAGKLGLTAIQQTSVYTSLFNFYSGKKELLDKLKNNALTQAAYNVAEAQLTTVKNNAIKSAMANSTQLAALSQFFGIK